MAITCNITVFSHRSTSWYGLEVGRHSLVLVHLLAELRQGAIFIRVFHLNYVLIVGLIRLVVGLEHLDVILNLISPHPTNIEKVAIQRLMRAMGLNLWRI